VINYEGEKKGMEEKTEEMKSKRRRTLRIWRREVMRKKIE
jgi:hypothetical protein